MKNKTSNYNYFKNKIISLSFFKTAIFIRNRIFVCLSHMMIMFTLVNIDIIKYDFNLNIDCEFNYMPTLLKASIISLFVFLFNVFMLTIILRLKYKTRN